MTIIKNEEDKKEFIGLITEAFQEVMIPALDDMENRLIEKLTSKEELGEFKQETMQRFDTLDRKFEAQQTRLDKHNERIETLEKIHPKGKHVFTAA